MKNPKQHEQPAGKLAGSQNYRAAPAARSARAKPNSARGWYSIAFWVAIAAGTTFICRWWLNHYAPWGKIGGLACGQSGACHFALGFGGLAVLLAASIWLLLVGVKKTSGTKAARLLLLLVLNLLAMMAALIVLFMVGAIVNNGTSSVRVPLWSLPVIIAAAYGAWFAWRYRRRQKISGAHDSAGRS
jgi:uncharacterized membrane protein